MKKLFFLPALLLVIGTTFAQIPNKGLQKVTFGTVLAVSGNTPITREIQLLKLGHNLSPNLCFVTNKTYHNFLYGISNNAGRVINGYKPKADLGLYIALVKNFSTRGGYVGIGAEKFIKAGDVTFFLFTEFGTNIHSLQNARIATVGMHVNVQSSIWKRKV